MKLRENFLIVIYVVILAAITMSHGTITLSNAFVAVVADENTGQFTIGRFSPTPFPLMQGFPTDPHYSHFCININNITYCNVPGIGDFDLTLRDSMKIYGDNTMSAVWVIGPFTVWEKFYILSPDSIDQFIYIEYEVWNETSDSNWIGILSYNDVRIGDVDAPLINAWGDTFRTEEAYQGSGVPPYVRFLREWPTDFTEVAVAVPFGTRHRLYADEIALIDTADNSAVKWEYNEHSRVINDLIMIVRWNPVELGSYESYLTGFYYGQWPHDKIEDMPENLLPARFLIGAPYPNPTNGGTSIQIEVLKHSQIVDVQVRDISGRVVTVLYSGEMEPGRHTISWDLRSIEGNFVSTGVYLIQVIANGKGVSRKVLVVK